MKKSSDALAETEKDIYECGRKCGNRDIFLDYWWKVQIEMSKSYAFAACHSREYSTECLQEMNLYRFFPKAYWNTAVITTQAQSDDERENTNGSINYGKIAQSIYKAKNNGVMVYPPDVNEAKLSFSVSADKEKILYGLSGISGINNDIANQIIANRPYDSFEDFLDKNMYKGSLITATKIKTLIFGGCFDCFNPDRVKIMKKYIAHETPAIESLTMANMSSIKGCGVSIPKEIVAPYNFYKYATAKERLYGAHPTAKSKKLYWLDEKGKAYFTKNLMPQLKEDVDYWYEDDKLIVVDKSIEKSLKVSLDRLKGYINDPSFLKEYRRAIMRQKYMDFIDGNESVEHWSFTALSYYSHNHELYNLDYDKYLLTKFCKLPEEPNFVEMSTRGRTWRRYEINAICGTVLDVNKNKHIVTILTPEDDVVNCKFNAEHFAYYTRQITDGEYTEKPWLKRGNLVILTGYRRGENEFAVKRYKNTVYNSSVKLIHSVNSDGSAVLQSKRYGEEEDEKM